MLFYIENSEATSSRVGIVINAVTHELNLLFQCDIQKAVSFGVLFVTDEKELLNVAASFIDTTAILSASW